MGDLNKTVEILFKGTDEVSGILSNITNSANDLASPFVNAIAGILQFEAALAGLATAGFVAATVAAGEFSAKMNEINTLVSISDADFNTYSQSVIEYATNSRFSIEDLQTALYNAVSLGIDYKDSIEAITVAERLAIAGRADLNTTTEALYGTMNAYGAVMDEAADYSDVFFTIIKDGKTTLPELAASISQVTGIAAAAGIPFETLGAAIAALTAAGTGTSEAMTQLKALIEAIINPSDGAAKAAAALGIDMSAAAVKSKGFEVVLREIFAATGGNIEQMAKLFTSTEALQAALVLGADKAGIFAKALADMGANTGATLEAFNKMKDNLDLVWQGLINNARAALILLGLEFAKESANIVQNFADAFKTLGASIEKGTFDPILDLIKQLLQSIDAEMKGINLALPLVLPELDFEGFKNSLSDIFTQIGIGFENLDLTTPEGLKLFLQSIIDTLTKLNKVVFEVFEALQPLVDLFTYLVNPAAEVSETIKNVGNVIKDLGDQLGFVLEHLDTFLKLWLGLQAAVAVGTLVAGIVGFAAALTTLTSIAPALRDMYKVVGDLVGSLTDASIAQRMKTVKDVFSGIGTAAEGVTKASAAADLGIKTLSLSFLSILGTATALATGVFALGQGLGYVVDKLSGGIANREAMEADIKRLQEETKQIQALGDEISKLPTNVSTLEIFTLIDNGQLEEAKALIDKLTAEQHEITVNTKVNEEEWRKFSADWEKLASDPSVDAMVSLAVQQGDFDTVEALLSGITTPKTIELKAQLDDKKVTETLSYFVDGKEYSINVKADTTDVDKAKEKIEKLPADKILEIKLQGDIDKELEIIKQSAATTQKVFEWTAQLNIAEVEAQTKRVESAFESINTAIQSTENLMGKALDTASDTENTQARWAALDILREEADLRQQSFDLQKKLTESEIKYNDAKVKALDNDSLIKIDSSGLEPALEMIMWQIVEKVQIRATQASSEFLLGI